MCDDLSVSSLTVGTADNRGASALPQIPEEYCGTEKDKKPAAVQLSAMNPYHQPGHVGVQQLADNPSLLRVFATMANDDTMEAQTSGSKTFMPDVVTGMKLNAGFAGDYFARPQVVQWYNNNFTEFITQLEKAAAAPGDYYDLAGITVKREHVNTILQAQWSSSALLGEVEDGKWIGGRQYFVACI